ncbi:hypothetical protein V2J09_013536 [Rumex salicifolius]
MAMRSAAFSVNLRSSVLRIMDGACGSPSLFPRYFSDGSGRILSEEERAAENVYIKKMEKEKLEKAKLKAEREKAEKEKEAAKQKSEGNKS